MNLPQSQVSTQEQLEDLKSLLIAAKYTPKTAELFGVHQIVRLANLSGLYDAADAIQLRSKTELLSSILSWDAK